jgi:hypothetical protein
MRTEHVVTNSRPTIQPKDVPHASSTEDLRVTCRLLAGGVIAGPLFVLVALAQILTRPGFDITRHPVSLLSLGDLGWIQSANFLVTGLFTIACAIGTRRVLRGGPGSTWAPALLVIYGTGFAAASVFHADPGNGFPPGTPDSIPATMSWHGTLHMVFGSLAFLTLIAVCVVFARRFAAVKQRGWAIGSVIAGLLFAIGLGNAMSGGSAGSLTLFVGASIALIWVALTSSHLIAETRNES